MFSIGNLVIKLFASPAGLIGGLNTAEKKLVSFGASCDARLNQLRQGLAGMAVVRPEAMAGLDKLKMKFDAVGQSAANAGKKGGGAGGFMSQFGMGAGLAGGMGISAMGLTSGPALLGFGAAGAVGVGMDFEKSMSRVKALVRPTAGEFDDLREKAMQLGRDTEFTASQAAQGMSEFALAGFKTQDILNSITPAVRLASVGMTDMKQSAEASAIILRSMRMDTTELTKVTDILAFAMSNSVTNMTQLQEAFKYAAPTARVAGMGIEDLAGAIMLLSDQGIQGSESGTVIRNMLKKTADQSEEARRMMDMLGMSFHDAAGNFKGFGTILNELNQKLNAMNLGDMQKLDVIGTLFEIRAGTGFSALLDQGDKYNETVKRIKAEHKGLATEIAMTQINNLWGDLKIFWSSAQDIGIRAFDAIKVPLRGVVQLATDLTIGLSKGLAAFAELASPVVKVMGSIASVLSGPILFLGKIAIGLGVLQLAMVATGAAVTALGAAFTYAKAAGAWALGGGLLGFVVANPYVAVAAGAAAATEATVGLEEGIRVVKEGWKANFELIGQGFKAFKNEAEEAFKLFDKPSGGKGETLSFKPKKLDIDADTTIAQLVFDFKSVKTALDAMPWLRDKLNPGDKILDVLDKMPEFRKVLGDGKNSPFKPLLDSMESMLKEKTNTKAQDLKMLENRYQIYKETKDSLNKLTGSTREAMAASIEMYGMMGGGALQLGQHLIDTSSAASELGRRIESLKGKGFAEAELNPLKELQKKLAGGMGGAEGALQLDELLKPIKEKRFNLEGIVPIEAIRKQFKDAGGAGEDGLKTLSDRIDSLRAKGKGLEDLAPLFDLQLKLKGDLKGMDIGAELDKAIKAVKGKALGVDDLLPFEDIRQRLQQAGGATASLAAQIELLKSSGARPEDLAPFLSAQTAGGGLIRKIWYDTVVATKEFGAQMEALRKHGAPEKDLMPLKMKQAEARLFEMNKRLNDAGAKVFEETRNPLEQAKSRMQDLGQLVEMGRISWDTYGRAVSKAVEGLEAAYDMKARWNAGEAVIRGSAEAISVTQRFRTEKTMPRTEQLLDKIRQATEQQKELTKAKHVDDKKFQEELKKLLAGDKLGK